MKLFACALCQNALFFENVHCTRCASVLAYIPDVAAVSPLERDPQSASGADSPLEGVFIAKAPEMAGGRVRLCRNYVERAACTWAVAFDDDNPLCRSCRLNEVIPNLANDAHVQQWRRLERAKRRLLYTLFSLGLPVESRRERPGSGLAFAFLAQEPGGPPVMTGHSEGLITINVAEADAPFREKMREQMGEAYRTLLGHFRHEVGHYYWDRLIRGSAHLARFREIFGDETASYDEALKRHYDGGPPADWPLRFVSAYASMHPWEDWAETWAHYLHMVETLDTARNYGLALRPEVGGREGKELSVSAKRLDLDRFDDLLAGWVPVTVAMNSLSRSMGVADPYPFVLSEEAIGKLRFVHAVIETSMG